MRKPIITLPEMFITVVLALAVLVGLLLTYLGDVVIGWVDRKLRG